MEKKFKKYKKRSGFIPYHLFDGWGEFLSFIGNFHSLYFGGEYKPQSDSYQRDRRRLMNDIDNIIRSSRK